MRGDDYAGHVRRLVDACHFEAMFVDDGFQFPDALPFAEHTALVGCPVRRILRIEAFAEAAAGGAGWPPFTTCRARFRQAIAEALAEGAVALKTIAAYRCGLDIAPPSLDDAPPRTTPGGSPEPTA